MLGPAEEHGEEGQGYPAGDMRMTRGETDRRRLSGIKGEVETEREDGESRLVRQVGREAEEGLNMVHGWAPGAGSTTAGVTTRPPRARWMKVEPGRCCMLFFIRKNWRTTNRGRARDPLTSLLNSSGTKP